jgi:hypothetical protein
MTFPARHTRHTPPSEQEICTNIQNQSTNHTILTMVFLRSVHRLLLTANVVPKPPILVTLITEAIRSSETLVLTRATRRNISDDGILHSNRHENLKSYIALTGWAL